MASETVADILREMRGCIPQKMEGFENGELVVLDTAKLADRIEAAVRRIRSRCYAAVDSEYDCAHGCEIRDAFKGEVNDDV